MSSGDGILVGTEGCIELNLIVTVLQTGNGLADIEQILCLTEFCGIYHAFVVGSALEEQSVPAFCLSAAIHALCLCERMVDDERGDVHAGYIALTHGCYLESL